MWAVPESLGSTGEMGKDVVSGGVALVKAKIFCDQVSRAIEKKVSLGSRTKK